MKLLLLTVLIIAVYANIAKLREIRSRQKIQQKSPCGNNHCLPGYDSVCEGFNVITGESTNQNICKFTHENKTFVDSGRNKVWGLPNELNARHIGAGSINVHTFTSTSQYQKFLMEKIGISGSSSWLGFSASASTEKIDKYLKDQMYAYTRTEQEAKVYHVTIATNLLLLKISQDLQETLDALPDEYDKELYREYLIKHFGTHFYSNVHLGGKGSTETFVKSSYVERHNERKVSANAQVDFSFLKANAEYQRHTGQNEKEWYSETTVAGAVEGGDPTRFKLSDWDKWLETINDKPRRMNGNVVPISVIIRDKTKKANVERAVNEYLIDNQRVVPPPRRQVPNCQHIRFGERPSSIIGEIAPNIYLVAGPLNDNECLATWEYKGVGQDTRRSGHHHAYSNTLRVHVYRFDNHMCSGSHLNLHYNVNGQLFNTGANVIDAHININAGSHVSSHVNTILENCGSCTGIPDGFMRCALAKGQTNPAIGMVYQPRFY